MHCGDPRSGALVTTIRCLVTSHNCAPAYRQRCPDLEFVCAVLGVPPDPVSAAWLDGAFDPFAAAAMWAEAFNTVSEGYAFEIEIAWQAESGGDAELASFSRFLAQRHLRLVGITNGIDPALKGPEALRGRRLIGDDF
jgi:glycogen synthase